MSLLENGGNLFVFNEKAKCSLASAEVESSLLEEDHHDDHKDDHHDDHEDDHHGEKHSEHDHGEEESHSEFKVTYQFACSDVGSLETMTVNLFNQFTSLEEVDVQQVGPGGQKKAELDAGSSVVKF